MSAVRAVPAAAPRRKHPIGHGPCLEGMDDRAAALYLLVGVHRVKHRIWRGQEERQL